MCAIYVQQACLTRDEIGQWGSIIDHYSCFKLNFTFVTIVTKIITLFQYHVVEHFVGIIRIVIVVRYKKGLSREFLIKKIYYKIIDIPWPRHSELFNCTYVYLWKTAPFLISSTRVPHNTSDLTINYYIQSTWLKYYVRLKSKYLTMSRRFPIILHSCVQRTHARAPHAHTLIFSKSKNYWFKLDLLC